MADFDSQVKALRTSAQRICDEAGSIEWNGAGWTPAIILGHIVDVDKEVWMARFALMCDAMEKSLPLPQLAWWEPDPVETAEKYASFTIEAAQKYLIASRESMVTYLHALSQSARSASAQHKTFGAITIESMLQVILNHDEEHRLSLHS